MTPPKITLKDGAWRECVNDRISLNHPLWERYTRDEARDGAWYFVTKGLTRLGFEVRKVPEADVMAVHRGEWHYDLEGNSMELDPGWAILCVVREWTQHGMPVRHDELAALVND